MRRMWPDEFDYVFENAETVTLEAPAFTSKDGLQHEAINRKALKVRLPEQDLERLWPLAEARYRLGGKRTGQAITLIANNPHYHPWHPADGGIEEIVSESGATHSVRYVTAFFLLDDVSEPAVAA